MPRSEIFWRQQKRSQVSNVSESREHAGSISKLARALKDLIDKTIKRFAHFLGVLRIYSDGSKGNWQAKRIESLEEGLRGVVAIVDVQQLNRKGLALTQRHRVVMGFANNIVRVLMSVSSGRR